jgi:hypothetical protein
VVPGEVAALVTGEESAILDGSVIGVKATLVGCDLGLCVVGRLWKSEVAHLNLIIAYPFTRV